MSDFAVVEAVMEEAVGRVFPAAQLVVRVHGEIGFWIIV
jgi:hypothetical protein